MGPLSGETEPWSSRGAEERPESAPEDDQDDGGPELFRALGRQIRVLRERAGLTQRQLGDHLGYGEALVSSIERGRRTPQPEFLEAADRLLDAGGVLQAATEEVVRAKARARVRHPAWFRDYARLETDAVEISYFSTHTIPGLLQTEGHARALYTMRKPMLSEELIEQRVTARMSRKEILTNWPPPIVTCVIEEAVLQRPLGGRDVHAQQLATLLETAQLRNVELQVMPTERTGHAGMGGPFVLLTPKGKQQVAYGEVQNIRGLVTDQEEVRILAARYGSVRAQALTPGESLALIEKVLGDL